MTAGALAAATTPAQKPFILTVGGRNVTPINPVGEDFACRFSEVGEGSASEMTFWLEDLTGSAFLLRMGEAVWLVDRRGSYPRTLFGGHLVNAQMRRRDSAAGRLIQCTAVGHDIWLNWRTFPRWSSKEGGITFDRRMVQQLVNRYAGFLYPPDATVQLTNNSMEPVTVSDSSMREALDRVAQTATYIAPENTRHYYVDNDRQVHYYKNTEDLAAPYRISDGSYVGDILATTGLVSLWTLSESTGAAAGDARVYAPGTLAGGYQRGLAAGVPNEPGMHATALNGASGYMAASGADLHPGDTVSFECWYRRRTTGSTQTLWSGGASDLEVRFTASDLIAIVKQGVSIVWSTSAAFTDTSAWHHLVVTKSGSTRAIYVDGVVRNASGTNATIVAGSGTVNIGRVTTPGQYFAGSLQHVAIYSTALSAATVLAHHRQGLSLAPEDLVLELDAMSGREAVYVKGGTDSGTGWVVPGQGNAISMRTAFGQDEPVRQEIIERKDSTGPGKRDAYGAAFLKQNSDPDIGGSFSIVGYDGWRVGQILAITDSALGLDAWPAEIKQIDTDVLWGNGVLKYTIQFGKPVRSGTRRVGRGLGRKR